MGTIKLIISLFMLLNISCLAQVDTMIQKNKVYKNDQMLIEPNVLTCSDGIMLCNNSKDTLHLTAYFDGIAEIIYLYPKHIKFVTAIQSTEYIIRILNSTFLLKCGNRYMIFKNDKTVLIEKL